MTIKKKLKKFMFSNAALIVVLVVFVMIAAALLYVYSYPVPQATLNLQNTTDQAIGVGIISDLHTVYNSTIPAHGTDTVRFSANHSTVAIKFFYNHASSNWTTLNNYVSNTDTIQISFNSNYTITARVK